MALSSSSTSFPSCCNMCQETIDDYLNYGEIMKRSNLTVHYYCILLSTNLMQRGQDKSGFLGFQLPDVRAEIRKAKTRQCHYCKKYYASIKCKECPIYFHLKCGLENSCNFEFIGQFLSSCHQHNKYLTVKINSKYNPDSLCSICYTPLGEFNPINFILPKCCKKRWIHRKCMQLYAFKSGYYFFCILCKNLEFRNDIKYQGIFVPDRDAEWELDKTFFSNLYKRYSKCDAEPCHLTMRSDFKKSGRKSEILLCNCCASSGIHKICMVKNYSDLSQRYTCTVCIAIFNKSIYGINISMCRTLIGSHLAINSDIEKPTSRDESLYIKKHTICDANECLNISDPVINAEAEENVVNVGAEENAVNAQTEKNIQESSNEIMNNLKVDYVDDSEEEFDSDLFDRIVLKYYTAKISNMDFDGKNTKLQKFN